MWSAKRVVVGCAYALATLCASQVADALSHDILGEGDVVHIVVFQNPDLTTEARISERGAINFPLIGEVTIGGLAPSDAEARIAQQLSRGKFVVRPQVNLTVLQVRSRQVSVLGQVGRPGRYPLDDVGNNLIDVLALAGGITPGETTTSSRCSTATVSRAGRRGAFRRCIEPAICPTTSVSRTAT